MEIQALPRTALTLDRYARFMGINPLHFRMGYTDNVYPIMNGCDDVWFRYSWQHADKESLMSLAQELRAAEEELERFVGFPLTPKFISNEEIRYPTYLRPEYVATSGLNVRGYNKGVNARWMKMIDTGVRGTTELALGTNVTYTDDDTDTFFETATISITITPAQYAALNDSREIKVYFDGTNAHPDWEVRYPNRVDITYNAGPDNYTVIMIFDSWLLIDPELQSSPTMNGYAGGLPAINLTASTAEFVSTVDVYQEFNDKTQPSAVFVWENISGPYNGIFPQVTCYCCNGSGCEVCNKPQQSGCAHIRDSSASIVSPIPATYDEDSASWQAARFAQTREPDTVNIFYKAGDISVEYSDGYTPDPLSQFWAETIAALATARLGRNFCGCSGSTKKAEWYQTDKARSGEDFAYTIDFSLTKNPFGTRVGEILAYNRVSAYNQRRLDAVLI